MKVEAKTIRGYLEEIPEERKSAFLKLRETIRNNIPGGFEETKNYIALYHMGIYTNPDHIPFDLIGDLMRKISVQDWIQTYEKHIKR